MLHSYRRDHHPLVAALAEPPLEMVAYNDGNYTACDHVLNVINLAVFHPLPVYRGDEMPNPSSAHHYYGDEGTIHPPLN